MEAKQEYTLLRIFMASIDKVESHPLYEAIVFAAKKKGMAGATVFKGIMGFGASSLIHTSKIFELTDDVPIIVEIVDKPDKIEAFIEDIEPMIQQSKLGGLISTEKINAIIYKGHQK